jgi:hypothetical protein
MISREPLKCLLVMLLITASSTAGSFDLSDAYNNGDPFISDNYTVVDLIETNGAPEDPAFNYYRNPRTVSDMLIVDPTGFSVEVTGPDVGVIASQLEMEIRASEGVLIPRIGFREVGTFGVAGDPNSFVSAQVDWSWQVMEGQSAGATGSGTESFSAFANNSGSWELSFSEQIPDGTTALFWQFTNRLGAAGLSGTTSIAKVTTGGIEIALPEPAAGILFGLGALILLVSRRRAKDADAKNRELAIL